MSEYTVGADYLAGALDPINIRRQNNAHKWKWWRMVKRAQNGSELLRCIGWGLKCSKPTREFESKAKSFLLDSLFRGEDTTDLCRATQIATEWLKSHDRYLRALVAARRNKNPADSKHIWEQPKVEAAAEPFWAADLEWTRLWESKERYEDEDEEEV